MTENPNQPREYDAVLGGESQVPFAAAVLGGIPGVKSRLASPIVEVKIAALSEALKYGDAGLDLIIGVLQDKSMAVKFAAYSLLRNRDEEKIQQHLRSSFEFDVIAVDATGKENSRSQFFARFFPEDLGNSVVLEMVSIPDGVFMMGSPETEEGRKDRESPQHQVKVPAFLAGKYPITEAQWRAVMEKNPSVVKGEKRPLIGVSWQDAVKFCDKLSEKTGKKYRLLSEAEWEYACRGGTTGPFHFGETITIELVNHNKYPAYANAPPTDSYNCSRETTDVGSFTPNAFGLYDMHGNVWEWCSDTWHENYNGAPTDGSSWETGTNDKRMQRGGSWEYSAVYCRSATRLRYSASFRAIDVGFRVAGVLA